MWESILQLLEGLISRVPSRDEMARGFEGLRNSIPRWIRQPDRPQPIEPISKQEREEATGKLTPVQEAEASVQKAKEGISRIQQMLENLGKDRPAAQQETGPDHVIVDNAKDLRPVEQPKSDAAAQPPKSTAVERVRDRLDGLKNLQSPEWQAMPEAERAKRYAQRFPSSGSSPQPHWDRLIQRAVAVSTARRNQQPVQVTPPPRTNQQRQPRSWTQRLSTLMRWQSRPQKMVNWGRKLQMGAGRLMAAGGGNQVVSRVASGMSRLGLALEGLGTARITGAAVGIAGFTAAVVAAPVALWSFVKGVKSYGENLLAEQQRLAPFGMKQLQASMITSISQTRHDIEMAQNTGPNTLELARELSNLRRQTQPLEATLKNLELKLGIFTVQLATSTAAGLNSILEARQSAENFLTEKFAWLLGGDDAVEQARDMRRREEAAEQPRQIVMPAQEFIRGLRQGLNNGLGQRRPLDPIR